MSKCASIRQFEIDQDSVVDDESVARIIDTLAMNGNLTRLCWNGMWQDII